MGLLAVTGALPQLTEVTLNAPQGNSSAGAGGEGEGGLARRDCSALADSLAARSVTLIQVRRRFLGVDCYSLSRGMSERPATQQRAWQRVLWPWLTYGYTLLVGVIPHGWPWNPLY